MAQPGLLLNVKNTDIELVLRKVKAVNRFHIDGVNNGDSWVDCLAAGSYQVAIVQVDDFSESECSKLIGGKLLTKIDVIFVSDGEPNEFVDRAMRHGVSYHLRLPVDGEFVHELLGEIYAEIELEKEPVESVTHSELDQFGLLVGSSPVMRKLYRVVRKAAVAQSNVFIVGESGSGKELVANTVHLASTRCDKPFVALNCGALSPELIESELFGHMKGAFTGAHRDRAGVFEQAEGGTLFLDEVTEMPAEHQVKLLRVLETGEFRPVGSDTAKTANVRVISATNREPAEAIKEDIFREDLYFRLAHFPIRVPPLRERGSDIPGLAKHFLAYRNAEEKTAKEISTEALEKIQNYFWPGNVRELKHAIERAYILADDAITEEHLILDDTLESNEPNATTLPSGMPLDEVEKGVILKTLAANNGNKTETANQLGVSIKTLYNKLEKYSQSE